MPVGPLSDTSLTVLDVVYFTIEIHVLRKFGQENRDSNLRLYVELI